MKIKEGNNTVYLENYDINVNKYLTYAQIQTIVNSTEVLMKSTKTNKDGTTSLSNSWAERQTNIDMLLLVLATDLKPEEIEGNHSAFLQSGLIDEVKGAIENYWQLEEAFAYTESWDKVLIDTVKKLTDILKNSNPKAVAEAIADGGLRDNG